MRRPGFGCRIAKQISCCSFGAALTLLGAIAVLGQDGPRPGGERPDPGGPYPRLPGVVTKAPDWIGDDAPFDVKKYFAAVPRDRNAAPLYLDALFEFGSELAVCFPEGPERTPAPGRQRSHETVHGGLRTAPQGRGGRLTRRPSTW